MIYIKVKENGVLHTFDSTISDSVKYETVKFDFPKSWDGYTKTAIFRNGDITLSVILNSDSDLCVDTDECYIPHEVIKSPEFTVSVFGVSGDSRVTASQAAIRVIQSGYGEGGEPSDPTPSEYEQLIALANETKEIALSVRTDADNGAFKGEPFTYSDFTAEQLAALKGEKGDPFTYEDFTAEQLASLKGKDGIDGKDGTNGTDGYTPQKGVDYFTDEDIAGLNIPSVDQAYAPDSENAQSGKAVAQALSSKADETEVNRLKDDLGELKQDSLNMFNFYDEQFIKEIGSKSSSIAYNTSIEKVVLYSYDFEKNVDTQLFIFDYSTEIFDEDGRFSVLALIIKVQDKKGVFLYHRDLNKIYPGMRIIIPTYEDADGISFEFRFSYRTHSNPIQGVKVDINIRQVLPTSLETDRLDNKIDDVKARLIFNENMFATECYEVSKKFDTTNTAVLLRKNNYPFLTFTPSFISSNFEERWYVEYFIDVHDDDGKLTICNIYASNKTLGNKYFPVTPDIVVPVVDMLPITFGLRAEYSTSATEVKGFTIHTKWTRIVSANEEKYKNPSSVNLVSDGTIAFFKNVNYNIFDYGYTEKDKYLIDCKPISIRIYDNPNAVSYKIYVSDNPKYINAKVYEYQYCNSYDFYNLLPDHKYFIKVTFVNNSGVEMVQREYSIDVNNSLRIIKTDNIQYFRDLGGRKSVFGCRTNFGRIYRSATLSNASEYDLSILSDMNITVEFDFRDNDADDQTLSEFYRYQGMTSYGQASLLKNPFEKLLQCLKENKNINYHCTLGSDRTGFFTTVLLGILGVSENDIIKDYEISARARNTFSTVRDNMNYIRGLSGNTLADKFETFLITDANISKADIDDFRRIMLQNW